MTTSRPIRKLFMAFLAIALFQSSLLLVTSGVADAQPFSCSPGFYQVINGQLNEFDPATDKYTPLGSQQARYNAIGLRPADGYLYGVQAGNLVRVGSNGVVTNLGPLGLPKNAYTGDFADDGLLHISAGGSHWHTVDVDTVTVTPIPELSVGVGVADIANVNGMFYGVSTSGRLYRFDPVAKTVLDRGPVSGVSGSGAFGAAWSTSGGNLYVGRNSGAIYQVVGYSNGTPQATQVATAQSTNSNDGGSCPYAPPPTGVRDVDGPQPETQPSTPEGAAAQAQWNQQYEQQQEAAYEFEDAGLGEGASCGATVNEDRLPRQTVSAGQYADGSVIYQTGFDGDANALILSGKWKESGGELQQLLDCGYDYTALLRTPQVEYFRFETRLRALEGANGGGIVFNQSSEHTRSGAMIVDLAASGTSLRWGQYDSAGYYRHIGSAEVHTFGTNSIAVEVRGTEIDIFFNGSKVGATTTDQPGGYVGLVTTRSKVAFTGAVLTALAPN